MNELIETLIDTRPPPGTVVAVEGTLDPAAATALRDGLTAMPAGQQVILDFTHARSIEDIALAALADGLLADRRVEVRFRGLSQHHERVLRYLGMDPAAFGLAGSGVDFPATS